MKIKSAILILSSGGLLTLTVVAEFGAYISVMAGFLVVMSAVLILPLESINKRKLNAMLFCLMVLAGVPFFTTSVGTISLPIGGLAAVGVVVAKGDEYRWIAFGIFGGAAFAGAATSYAVGRISTFYVLSLLGMLSMGTAVYFWDSTEDLFESVRL